MNGLAARRLALIVAIAIVAIGAVMVTGAGAGTSPTIIGGFRPESPDVSAGRVVWADNMYGSYDVFVYEKSTGFTTRLTSSSDDEIEPSISGDKVVFTRHTSTGADIYAYDLSTDTESVVTNALGDQANPTISGNYVAWEDRSGGFNPQVYAKTLPSGRAIRIASGFSAAYERPVAGGEWVVYEGRLSGAGDDSNVYAYNFRTAEKVTVAATGAHERVPSTDGSYIVFADDSGGDSDIVGFDLASRSPFSIRMQPGEQTFPVVADGVAYWIDNGGEKRIHVDTLEIATSAFEPFNSLSTAEMVGMTAEAGNLAWLEPAGDGKWQVRALLESGGGPVVTVAADLLPDTPAWTSFRLAQVFAGSDDRAPEIEFASVEMGGRNVPSDASLAIYFDEDLDPRSVDDDAVWLRDSDGDTVAASVTYSPLADAIVVNPADDLSDGTFVLTIDGSVTDEAGNTLGEDYVAAFSTGYTLADTQIPSDPGNVRARVSGLSDVELTWNPSSDDSGIAAYHIYRHYEPMDAGNLGSATLVTDAVPGNVETFTVSAAGDEAAKKYTYFYAMIAEDTVGKLSEVSASTAPDPHGMHVFGASTNNCSLCHNTHGAAPVGWWALGAKSAEACYVCHGDTTHSTGYGYGSTLNTQARFWDYGTDPLPADGTQHRNAFMDAQNETCDACHTQHKRPYDQITGAYDASTSYSKLLKRPSDPADAGSALVYSTDAAPFDEILCYSCHGTELVYMTAKGGASAFSATAGDHNEAGFDAAAVAHGTGNVYATTRAGSDPGPLINCYACHNEHATPIDSLIDYRQSNTAATTYEQSGLCLECHKSASGESDSNGSAPFTWNGRDLAVQFAKSSTHPITAGAGGGGPQVGSWSQTTQAEFAGNTHSSTVALAGGTGTSGQVQLQSLGGGTFSNGGDMTSTTIAQAGGTVNGWTELTYTGDVPAGSTLTVDVLDGGDSSVLASGITPGQSPYSLAAIDANAHPTLKLRANMSGNGSGGSSISDDFNDASFDTVKWTDVHINATPPPVGGPYTDTEAFPNLTNWTITPGTTATWSSNAGQGSPAAPCAEFVRTGGTGLVSSKITRTYDFSSISGLQLTFNWQTNPAQIEPNTDYLRVGYDLGQDGTVDAWVWSSLTLQEEPGTWTAKGPLDFSACDGDAACDIVFEAAATQNTEEWYRVDQAVFTGTSAGGSFPLESGGELTLRAEGSDFWGTSDEGEFTYITPAQAPWIAGNDWDMTVKVPSINNLAGNAWLKAGLMVRTGTTVGNALAGGAKMAGVYQTGSNGVSFQYRTAVGGSATGTGAGSGTPPEWLKLERRGSNFTAYQSNDGAVWVQVGATQALSIDSNLLVGICLTSHVNGSYSEANFDDFLVQQTGTPSTVTPSLYDWDVGYVWTPPVLTSSLTCYNCHNTHFVETGSGVWDMDRVSDPDNTKSNYTGTPTAFCLECHDGGFPAATVNANTLVPYTVGVSDMSSYDFFTGWDKDQTGLEFTNSGHWAGGMSVGNMQAGCDNCHDPHASDNDRLTAFTRTSVAQHSGIDRNNSATYSEENLCYGCHNSQTAGPNCQGAGCHTANHADIDVYDDFQETYAHPVSTSGRHSDTEGASDFGSTNRHAECVDCHDPHAARAGTHTQGQSTAGPALRGAIGVTPSTWNGNWGTPTGWTAEIMSGESTDYEADLCFKCHSTYTTLPAGAYDVAREFNPDNQSGHNVRANVWPKTSTSAPDSLPYSWTFPSSNVFKTGWSTSSMMTCTDCHSGQSGGAGGPHGSSVQYILDSSYSTDWGSTSANLDKDHSGGLGMPTGLICAKCHDLYDGSNFGNVVHDEHEGRGSSGGYCTHCHIGIPHGWSRPRLLGYTSDPAPYAARSNGLEGITYQAYTPSNWDKADCGTGGCTDTSRHPNQGNPWP